MGTVFGKNTTSASITVAGHKVYYIDSADAEIVEVQDGNNVKFNAFKYLLSGTPYWYVIDGEHDTWTDDLSEWGYSEVQPVVELPTVSEARWLVPAVSSGVATVQSNGVQNCWSDLSGQQPINYDSSKSYGVIFWRKGDNTLGGHVEFYAIESDYVLHHLGVKNVSSQSLTVSWMQYAVCSSNLATVVTVYDSSNNTFNAFKYTASGTDYYYVLDGTQTDWTDDLAGIGYHDYLEVTLYMPGGSSNLKYCQPNVTSGYTGQPDSNYLYGIFTDSSCTQTFNYDSTKRYERGWYSNGEWNVASLQSIADMPSTAVSSDGKKDFILVSSGGVAKAWYISNLTTSSYLYYPNNNPLSIIYRIYSL